MSAQTPADTFRCPVFKNSGMLPLDFLIRLHCMACAYNPLRILTFPDFTDIHSERDYVASRAVYLSCDLSYPSSWTPVYTGSSCVTEAVVLYTTH